MGGAAVSFNQPHERNVWNMDAIWPLSPLTRNIFFICRILKSIDVDVYLFVDFYQFHLCQTLWYNVIKLLYYLKSGFIARQYNWICLFKGNVYIKVIILPY